jgi:hypothetical protein
LRAAEVLFSLARHHSLGDKVNFSSTFLLFGSCTFFLIGLFPFSATNFASKGTTALYRLGGPLVCFSTTTESLGQLRFACMTCFYDCINFNFFTQDAVVVDYGNRLLDALRHSKVFLFDAQHMIFLLTIASRIFKRTC